MLTTDQPKNSDHESTDDGTSAESTWLKEQEQDQERDRDAVVETEIGVATESGDLAAAERQKSEDSEKDVDEKLPGASVVTSVETECGGRLLVTLDSVTQSSEAEVCSPPDGEADTYADVCETAENAVHCDQHQMDQEQEQDAFVQAEDEAEIVAASESWNSASEEKRTAKDNGNTSSNEDNDDNDDDDDGRQSGTAAERNFEDDLERRRSPQRQSEDSVEREVDVLCRESGRGDGVMQDVPDSEMFSTPIKTQPSHEEAVSASPPLSSPATGPPPPLPTALLFPGDGPPVAVIQVTCGDHRAEFHVDRLADGLGAVANSIGTSRTSLCVRTIDDGDHQGGVGGGVWMTPNQFQRASGRGTARDWKRSVKHHGFSLKSLLSKAILSFDPASPGCRCNICTVSVCHICRCSST